MRTLHAPLRVPVAALSLALALAAPSSGAEASAKIDPWVTEQLGAAPQARVPVVVELAQRADLSDIAGTKEQKGAEVFRRLTAVAERSQQPLLARLAELGVPSRSFWVANVVSLEADAVLVAELSAREDVARIVGDSPVRVPVVQVDAASSPEVPETIEWNVAKVNADDVWALGFRGQSAVVAGEDTGYFWQHTALQAKYRGWNGVTADHNYNWHDAIHSGGGSCGANSPVPCDDHGHGTHTMGTMVGDDGGTNQVGVAPGARWIGCRNMDVGNGTPTTYIECFQFFLAPTDLAGQNPDPSLAPDSINNSWGCPTSEGCNSGNFATMNTVVENLRAAGIAVVASAGNDGSACSTVNSPAAIFESVISVGSTTSADAASSFSSRGPVTVDGSNRRKPDVAAPGSSVRSSTRTSTTSYGTSSGTSMAGPHVAAAVALIVSAQPALRGDVDTIEDLIEQNTLPLTTSQGCGGDTSSQVPNNVYGWGRLDVLAAVQAALALDLLTVDDFELGTFCRWDELDPAAPLCQ